MEDKIISLEATLGEHDNKTIVSRYRTFLFSGFGRLFLTRVSSILYIILVTRFIDIHVQEQIIYLSNAQLFIGLLSLLGFGYSLTRQAIVENDRSKIVSEGLSTIIIIGAPITVILNVVIAYLGGFSLEATLFYLVSCILYLFLQITFIFEDSRLETNKKLLILAIFSVLNSLLVPTFFIIFGSLIFVLVAWNISLLISVAFMYKPLILIFQNFTFNFNFTKAIFWFGFPVFITQIFSNFVQRLNSFILFLLFPEGELSQYFWALRLAEVFKEFLVVFLVGAIPLYSKLYKQSSYEIFVSRVKSILKIGIIFCLIIFGGVFISSKLIVVVILSSGFIESVILLQIFSWAMLLLVIQYLVSYIFLATGKTRYMLEASVSGNILRLLLIPFVYSMGGLGFSILIFFYYSYILFFYSFRAKEFITGLFTEVRFLLLLLLQVFFIFFVPPPQDIFSGILIGISYLILSFGLIILIKPFRKDDIELIERIIGIKVKKISGLLRYISA